MSDKITDAEQNDVVKDLHSRLCGYQRSMESWRLIGTISIIVALVASVRLIWISGRFSDDLAKVVEQAATDLIHPVDSVLVSAGELTLGVASNPWFCDKLPSCNMSKFNRIFCNDRNGNIINMKVESVHVHDRK